MTFVDKIAAKRNVSLLEDKLQGSVAVININFSAYAIICVIYVTIIRTLTHSVVVLLQLSYRVPPHPSISLSLPPLAFSPAYQEATL